MGGGLRVQDGAPGREGELPLRPLLDALCLDHVILLFLAGRGEGLKGAG